MGHLKEKRNEKEKKENKFKINILNDNKKE